MKENIEIKCLHQEIYTMKISHNFSLCFGCSSSIINDKLNNEISTIKPKKYSVKQENATPIILSIYDTHISYSFLNKSDYIKIRVLFIKKIKLLCNNFELNIKTFFLSVDYFDRICSKLKSFELEALNQISNICVILAAKFQENGKKGIEIKKKCGLNSSNYLKDELYLLQLLNYDLHIFTSYDILIDCLYCGFIFSDETFSTKKMHFLYEKIINILYLFSETRYYIDMTYKEISLAIIGFIRENLGLDTYNIFIKNIFMNDNNDEEIYLLCVNKLKKCFKFINNKDNGNGKKYN